MRWLVFYYKFYGILFFLLYRWGGKDQYKVQLYHDKLKRDYAKEHNYILIEIPYTVNTQEKVNKYLDKYLN